MHTKFSIIALAVASVISSSALAAQWEDPSTDAQKITSTEHKDIFVNEINKKIDFTANIQKGQQGEYVQAYSTVQANQTSTNIEGNSLWVTNKTNGANASAFQINGGGVAINNGKIFLKGESGNFEHTHGFAIQDGSAINNGIVVADSAVGMIINSSGSGTITNGKNGEISAINGGAAMEIGKKLNTDRALLQTTQVSVF